MLVAVFIAIMLLLRLPTYLDSHFVESAYSIGILTTSVMLPSCLIALVIIVSKFQRPGDSQADNKSRYTTLIECLEFTLYSIFVCLCFAIFFYIRSTHLSSIQYKFKPNQTKFNFVIFSTLLTYSLVSVIIIINTLLSYLTPLTNHVDADCEKKVG
jgi:hypothetical protein